MVLVNLASHKLLMNYENEISLTHDICLTDFSPLLIITTAVNLPTV